jgi:hypothetical protein
MEPKVGSQQSAIGSLQSAVCGLETADWRLQTGDCRLSKITIQTYTNEDHSHHRR